MMDHVLRFADEAAAQAALPVYCIDGAWDGSRVIAPVSVVTADAVWEGDALVSPRAVLPGYWLAIALDEVSADLVSLPGDVLRFVAERETGAFAFLAADIDAGLLSTARVDPVFAGSGYWMGVGDG
jgi:hypothetical protein